MDLKKRKLGLALSGASSRSIFYIGFLEVMQEHGVVFDYISACSGATIVAASFVAGTMDLLKQRMLTMKSNSVFDMLEYSENSTGIYNLERFEDVVRFYSKGLKFEESPVSLGFIASDIVSGNQVVLNIGDIARAARISCTLPGICEPVIWGNKVLVDGGLLSIVPGDVAKNAGCDFVVGIDMRGNRHIFSKSQIKIKQALNLIQKNFLVSHTIGLWKNAYGKALGLVSEYYSEHEEVEESINDHNLLTIVSRALDIAIEAQKHPTIQRPPFDCDLLIVPELPKKHIMKRYIGMVDFSNAKELYEKGRQIAEEKISLIVSR